MNRTLESQRPVAVRISSAPEQLAALNPLLGAARSAVGDVPALLELAKAAGDAAPNPGEGRTGFLWEILASVTAVDVAAGRAIEPHLDAAAILSQARGPGAPRGQGTGTWGVFAAEAAGLRLRAEAAEGTYLLHGAKPWCSLAARLDHAVVTANLDDGGRAAFAVDLHAPGVRVDDPQWTSQGLREIPSGTVHFDAVPAEALGGAGWYYRRPGFAWGGMGVAACWLGGAVAVARGFQASLRTAAHAGREPDQIALASLGEIDRTLAAVAGYLARTAGRIDGGDLSDAGAWSEALRVRGHVATAVERIQTLVSQNLGPAPLAFDPVYGKRMADLSLYIRQHHALRDDAQLGARTLKADQPW